MKQLLIGVCLVIAMPAAHAELQCDSPLVYTGRDESHADKQEQLISYGYSNICSGKTTKAGLDFSSSTTAIVEALPIKSVLSFGARKEKAEQFCKEQADYQNSSSSSSSATSIVVRESLRAYEVCMAMKQADVHMDFDIGSRIFSVKVARGRRNSTFQGIVISPKDAALCTMTNVSGGVGTLTKVEASTSFPLDEKEVAITCEKNIVDGVVPGLEAYIKTSEKSAPLTLEPDYIFTPQYASSMRQELLTQDKEFKRMLGEQEDRIRQIGSAQHTKDKPIVMTGGKGWDRLELCPAGYYVSGVGAHGGGGGDKCYNCVETVKFVCAPFTPSQAVVQ